MPLLKLLSVPPLFRFELESAHPRTQVLLQQWALQEYNAAAAGEEPPTVEECVVRYGRSSAAQPTTFTINRLSLCFDDPNAEALYASHIFGQSHDLLEGLCLAVLAPLTLSMCFSRQLRPLAIVFAVATLLLWHARRKWRNCRYLSFAHIGFCNTYYKYSQVESPSNACIAL